MAKILLLTDPDDGLPLAKALAAAGQDPLHLPARDTAGLQEAGGLEAMVDRNKADVVVLGPDDVTLDEMLRQCRRLSTHERTQFTPVVALVRGPPDTDTVTALLDAGARDVVNLADPIELAVARIDNMARLNYLRQTYRRHHDEITARTAELSSLFDAVTMGIAVSDHAGHLIRLNPAGHMLLGSNAPIASESAENVGLLRRTGGRPPLELDPLYRAAVRGHSLRKYPVVLSAAGGRTERVLVFDAQPLTDPDDRRIGALVVFRDETEAARLQTDLRKEAAELARRNGEIEAFIYTASHDMKSPLRTIRRYATIMLEDPEASGADRASYLQRIEINAVRLFNLVDGLVRVVQVGKMELHAGHCDMGLVIGDALQHLEALMGEAQATIEVEAGLPTVVGDHERLVDLFQNLVSNAVKYRRPDLPCRVQVGQLAGTGDWHFYVRDNGIGIAADHHTRIFGLFHRLHSRDAIEGSGLGLAIVARIAERHGGRVWVSSEPNQGATFHVLLPNRSGSQPREVAVDKAGEGS